MKSNNKNILSGVVSCGRLFAALMLALNSRMVLAVAESGATADTVQASSFDVAYFVPGNNVETGTKIKVDKKEEDVSIYYSLGGMRLRFAYSPSPAEVPVVSNIRWELGSDTAETKGRICSSFKIDSCSEEPAPKHVLEANPSENAKIKTVFWEPEEWLVTNALTAKLVVEYNDPANPGRAPKEESFKVNSRLLQPVADDQMKGSDVGMLEDVLWRLGFSPQLGYPGASGNRIDSINPAALAKQRDVFSVGHGYKDRTNAVTDRKPGYIEKKVRRLQGHYYASGTGSQRVVSSGEAGSAAGTPSGIVDNSTLLKIKELYTHYLTAYSNYNNKPVIGVRQATQDMLNNAMAGWDETYTETIHSGDPANANDTGVLDAGETVTRKDLLVAWIKQEGGSQWGKGYPATHFRITEGGGDEYGSIGFNQILFQYSYGANKDNCVDGMNMMDPSENLRAFGLFTSITNAPGNDPPRNCDRPLWHIFANNEYILNYNNQTDAFPVSTLPRLRGYYRSAGNISWIGSADTYHDDKYDRLSKAIMGYNAGQSKMGSDSWLKLLLRVAPVRGYKSSNTYERPAHGIQYSINVKNVRAGMRYKTFRLEWQVSAQEAETSVLFFEGDTFCFDYSEMDWFNSDRQVGKDSSGNPIYAPVRWWTTVRDEVLNGVTDEVSCSEG